MNKKKKEILKCLSNFCPNVSDPNASLTSIILLVSTNICKKKKEKKAIWKRSYCQIIPWKEIKKIISFQHLTPLTLFHIVKLFYRNPIIQLRQL